MSALYITAQAELARGETHTIWFEGRFKNVELHGSGFQVYKEPEAVLALLAKPASPKSNSMMSNISMFAKPKIDEDRASSRMSRFCLRV